MIPPSGWGAMLYIWCFALLSSMLNTICCLRAGLLPCFRAYFCLFVCLFVSLFVCLFVYLFVCLLCKWVDKTFFVVHLCSRINIWQKKRTFSIFVCLINLVNEFANQMRPHGGLLSFGVTGFGTQNDKTQRTWSFWAITCPKWKKKSRSKTFFILGRPKWEWSHMEIDYKNTFIISALVAAKKKAGYRINWLSWAIAAFSFFS